MEKTRYHIYTARLQPATNFVDNNFDPPRRIKWSEWDLARCWNCQKLHRLKNMVVQVYYDGLRFFCRDKVKCKKCKRGKK